MTRYAAIISQCRAPSFKRPAAKFPIRPGLPAVAACEQRKMGDRPLNRFNSCRGYAANAASDADMRAKPVVINAANCIFIQRRRQVQQRPWRSGGPEPGNLRALEAAQPIEHERKRRQVDRLGHAAKAGLYRRLDGAKKNEREV